jgi:hypothetical protein
MTSPTNAALRTHYLGLQSTHDTMVAWAGTHACRLLEMNLDGSKEFKEVEECAGVGSPRSDVAGKMKNKWSIKGYVKPNAAGTAPDIGDVLHAAFGDEVIVGGTSVTYSFDPDDPKSLQLMEMTDTNMQQQASGAWVEQLDLEAKGGEFPLISASGGYSRHMWAHGTTTTGAGIGDAIIPLTAGQDGAISVGALVSVGADTARTVTAVTPATPSITVDPVLASLIGAGAAVIPYAPAASVAGTLITSVADYLTIDAAPLDVISAKLSFKPGWTGWDDECGSDHASRVLPGAHNVEGEFQLLWLDHATGYLYGKAWDGTVRTIAWRIGPNTAGQRLTVNIRARLNISPIKVAGKECVKWVVKFSGRMNSADGDELNFLLN